MSECTWVSAETEPKEADFRGILRMHIPICKGIIGRYGSGSYLYVDLYAGPGCLQHEGREFSGSPLIARDELSHAALPYEAVHFERNPETAATLAEALYVPTSLLDCPNPDTSPIRQEPHESGFPRWLEENGLQPNRYGLVYADPINDEIPLDSLNKAARYLPKVDLLSYVSATQYKRRRGQDIKRNGYSDKPLLSEHIKAVSKRYALIRKPRAAWQFTFVLWSNWVDLPDWNRRGFYRLDSTEGQQILDQLDLNKDEHKAKANTPLPFDPDPPYRTYREYLRHPRFLAVRKQVFERAGGKCERCGIRPPTEPHHLRYPPWGTFDVPENLVAICHQCHCDAHGKAS